VGTGCGGEEVPSCGAGAVSQGAVGSAGRVGAAAVGHPPCVVWWYGSVANTLAALLSAHRLRCCT
jgi:hypothetical protein